MLITDTNARLDARSPGPDHWNWECPTPVGCMGREGVRDELRGTIARSPESCPRVPALGSRATPGCWAQIWAEARKDSVVNESIQIRPLAPLFPRRGRNQLVVGLVCGATRARWRPEAHGAARQALRNSGELPSGAAPGHLCIRFRAEGSCLPRPKHPE